MRNGQADRYFSIRYKSGDRTVEEGVGWATSGWNAEKAHLIICQIKVNKKTGIGPQSLSQLRAVAENNHASSEEQELLKRNANITLEKFFDKFYLPHAKRTKRTWKTDELRFNKLLRPTLGKKSIQSINSEQIQKIMDSLQDDGAAPSTIKHYKSILSSIFTLASNTTIKGHLVFNAKNPTLDLNIPAVKNSRERFLTGEEADRLISAAKKLTSIDLHDCIVLSLNTGLRLGELQRLEWLDVDMTNAILTVRDEENRKPGGKIPLNDKALEILKSRQNVDAPTQGLVFPPLVGNTLRGNLSHSFRHLVESINLNEGIPLNNRTHRVVFHTLRHTFASWLAIAGTDIYRIQKLMRHKTITMTMRYAHLLPDMTREAVQNITAPKV